MVKPRSKKTQRRVQKNFYADVKTAKALEDVPSNPGRTIYIVKRGGKARGVVLACPCGCGSRLEANLMRSHWPSWRLRTHRNGTISLFPSLWVSADRCGSHFWTLKNNVRWAESFWM
jgi:hypothetical protein